MKNTYLSKFFYFLIFLSCNVNTGIKNFTADRYRNSFAKIKDILNPLQSEFNEFNENLENISLDTLLDSEFKLDKFDPMPYLDDDFNKTEAELTKKNPIRI